MGKACTRLWDHSPTDREREREGKKKRERERERIQNL
jgi:hypothetical protein